MQFNQVLIKWLILVISVILITACNYSSYSYNESTIHKLVRLPPKKCIIYFSLDQYDICSHFTNDLDTYVNLLLKNPNHQITIEGHTDEFGTPEYNIALGECYANAVKRYLRSKGVSDDQILIVSYGKEKLAVLSHDKLAYAKNRRAVLVY